jgi:F0F1-type ATP synthase assembly protein I
MDGGLDSGTNPLAGLLSATLSMSWQLAIVVLVPIIGGYELDKKLHTLPLLTVIGLIVATTGVALVVWRQLQLIASLAPPAPKEHRS